MRIIIDDKIPYIRGEAERLGETLYLPGAAITPDDVRHADALIIRTRTLCNSALLKGSSVRFIATATIGFDHLDTDFLHTAGIAWTNCPGCNAGSVAQYVRNSLLLLEADGRLPQPQQTTVGIVGVGHVGSAVRRELSALGYRLLLCDPPREATGEKGFVSLEKIEAEADVITFHTPLTRQGPHATYHLADAAFFARLQRRPVLINSSRGEVVDETALKRALSDQRISEAVIDTWEHEPDIDRSLLAAAYLATPHIAGYSADGKANGTRMVLEAVAAHFGIRKNFNILPPAWSQDSIYYPEAYDSAHPFAEHLRLYDPRRDSLALKAAPAQFESLRGHYPLRRESLS